jgi:heme/copper-type cytochrome/quinol oxidase subunit 3
VNHACAQRRVPFSWKKLLLWASLLTADLVFFGCWAGLYVAVVVAGSVASIAVMRQILGVWAAYLTTIPIGAVGFKCVISTVGGPASDLYEVLVEIATCLAFGAIFGGPVVLGVTCFLQFMVDDLAAGPQSTTLKSENVVVKRPQ